MIIDSAKFAVVVETAKGRAANEAAWLRAINRAADAILKGEMVVTILAHGAVVTTEGGTYRANGSCQCEAARCRHAACKHRAAARLMEMYEAAADTVVVEVAAPVETNAVILIEKSDRGSYDFELPFKHDAFLDEFKDNVGHCFRTWNEFRKVWQIRPADLGMLDYIANIIRTHFKTYEVIVK